MASGTHLQRKLEQLLPGVLEQRYRYLPFENGDIVPTMADLQVGTVEVVRETFSTVGDAAFVSGDAADIPVVDVSADEDRYKTVMIASAFSYSFQQWRAMENAGNAAEVDNRKMLAARRSIAEKANKLAAYGNTQLNITGFVNNGGVAVNNSSTDLYAATPDALAEFFIDELKAIYTASNNVEMPDKVLVSTDLDFLLMKTRITDGAMTVKKYILENLIGPGGRPMISSIEGIPELQWTALEANGVESGGTNKDRIIYYPMSPEVVERHVEPTQLMPEEWQMKQQGRQVIPMFHCCTQVIVNYPGAMKYIKTPKAS